MGLVWLLGISDGLIWLAYMVIPVILVMFVRKRPDLPFPWMFWMFGAFIVSCGLTHFMDLASIWWPAYNLSAVVRVITAIVSWGTIVALLPMTAWVMALRSPEQLQQMNDQLKREMSEREKIQEVLRKRNSELKQTNDALLQEIARHKQTYEQLQTSESRFRLLVDSVEGYSIIMLDASGLIASWNAVAAKMKGYAASEIMGKHFSYFYTPSDREHRVPEKLLDRAIADGRVEHSGWCVRKDGTQFWANVHITALRDPQGELRGFVKITNDGTERMKYETALAAKNAELEQANHTKNRFLAVMSHELRTPMNSIIGFAGTLLMKLPGPLNEEQEKQLNIIRKSARHLLSLINDMLDVAKIESGKVRLDLEPVVMQEVLREAVSSLRTDAEAKGLQLVVAAPEEPVTLLSDRRALSQIVLNLANNAIKFTEEGSVRLELDSEHKDGKTETCVRVVDTGIGISAAEREMLFQPFEQLAAARKRGLKGAGLGLHLCAKLAELLSGDIVLESEPGQGSTFTVVFRSDD